MSIRRNAIVMEKKCRNHNCRTRSNQHNKLYVISSGECEYSYIENIIKEKYSTNIALKKLISISQLHSSIPRDDKKLKEYKDQILKRINNAVDESNKEKSIIAIVIDRDDATHEEIETVRKNLMTKIKPITEYSIFILNSSQFENWLRHYFTYKKEDMKKHKDTMRHNICHNWDTKYKGKHENARENYFKENNCYFKDKKSIDNYCNIKNEYSDFPYFFDLLDNMPQFKTQQKAGTSVTYSTQSDA